jgi:hypothetical protein
LHQAVASKEATEEKLTKEEEANNLPHRTASWHPKRSHRKPEDANNEDEDELEGEAGGMERRRALLQDDEPAEDADEAAAEDGEGASEPVEGETSTVQSEVMAKENAEEKLAESEEANSLPHGTPSWHPARSHNKPEDADEAAEEAAGELDRRRRALLQEEVKEEVQEEEATAEEVEQAEAEDGEGSEPVEGETSTVQEEVAKQHKAEEKLLEQEEKEGLPHGTPSWHPARRHHHGDAPIEDAPVDEAEAAEDQGEGDEKRRRRALLQETELAEGMTVLAAGQEMETKKEKAAEQEEEKVEEQVEAGDDGAEATVGAEESKEATAEEEVRYL